MPSLAKALLFVFIMWIPSAVLFFISSKNNWRGDSKALAIIYFSVATIFLVFIGALKITAFLLPN